MKSWPFSLQGFVGEARSVPGLKQGTVLRSNLSSRRRKRTHSMGSAARSHRAAIPLPPLPPLPTRGGKARKAEWRGPAAGEPRRAPAGADAAAPPVSGAAVTHLSAASRRAGPGRRGRPPPPPLRPPPCPGPAEESAAAPFPGQRRAPGLRAWPRPAASPAPHGPGTAYSRPCSLLLALPLPPELARQPRQGARGCRALPRPGRPLPSSFPRRRHGLRGSEGGTAPSAIALDWKRPSSANRTSSHRSSARAARLAPPPGTSDAARAPPRRRMRGASGTVGRPLG